MAAGRPLAVLHEVRRAPGASRRPSRPGTRPPLPSPHLSPQDLLALQRLAGNRAVAELVAHRVDAADATRPAPVQRLAGPIVVQRTLAETVKRVATAIGVVATVGAIAAYFFIPTAV